jgi:hypothetical protein
MHGTDKSDLFIPGGQNTTLTISNFQAAGRYRDYIGLNDSSPDVDARKQFLDTARDTSDGVVLETAKGGKLVLANVKASDLSPEQVKIIGDVYDPDFRWDPQG